MKRLRIEFWWFCERKSGQLWQWANKSPYHDRRLNWLTAFTYRQRKQAERA